MESFSVQQAVHAGEPEGKGAWGRELMVPCRGCSEHILRCSLSFRKWFLTSTGNTVIIRKSQQVTETHTPTCRLSNVSDNTCPLPPLSVSGPVICSSPACTRTNRPQISGSESASWPRALTSPGNLQKCEFLTHSRLWSQKFYR